jgi:hypothetical protein
MRRDQKRGTLQLSCPWERVNYIFLRALERIFPRARVTLVNFVFWCFCSEFAQQRHVPRSARSPESNNRVSPRFLIAKADVKVHRMVESESERANPVSRRRLW